MQCMKEKKHEKCLDECVVNPKIGQTQDYCDCICNGGVKLNTNIPFVGRCISLGEDSDEENSTTVTQISAFPKLMRALMNILLTIILTSSLIAIIIGGVMIASSGANSSGYDQGKSLIKKVII